MALVTCIEPPLLSSGTYYCQTSTTLETCDGNPIYGAGGLIECNTLEIIPEEPESETNLDMVFGLIWLVACFFAWAAGFSKGGQR